MKQLILVLLIQAISVSAFAHEHGHGNSHDHTPPSKRWELKSEGETIQADFLFEQDGVVVLSDKNHATLELNIDAFSERDQQYILAKSATIETVNAPSNQTSLLRGLGFVLTGILLVLFSIYRYVNFRTTIQLAYGMLGLAFVGVGCNTATSSAQQDLAVLSTKMPANSVDFLTSIFGVFDEVSTRHDRQYFYIESDGIPDHEMMTGITNWQQQVPLPHPYSGDNSWAIPLQPELLVTPLSTKTNFMKGAIAIAANGIPIFNPLNNRGEDANAIGELDRWGGHCGRADDYHYHLPPTHLQTKVGADKPIAFALDGFPVYGETTEDLDNCLGRFNADSSYQYHAIKDYPYLIAAMRGKMEINPRTSAPENEITPQAKTRGVRPALRPLRGAAITGFETLAPNRYTLSYTLDSEKQVINYGWNEEGTYTFEFVAPDGTISISSYERE
ncbi:MAG: YHYH protein [Saprospiraceae bacterium]